MRNSILLKPLILCLFSFWLNGFFLVADAAAHNSDWSKTKTTVSASSNASTLLCVTPPGTSTTNITETSATFSWSAVAGAMTYSLQTRVPNGTWYTASGSPFGSTSATVTGFSPGTAYEWRVRANCTGGEYSPWTAGISFSTIGSSCNAPGWLGTTNITQTTATWDWSAASGALSYSLQWRYPGGTWYNLSGGPWTNTWVNVGNLEPGTTYEWRVRSNCANGVYSAWSYSVSFTTLGSYCNTPTWPSTSNITQTSATFSWSPVSGAQSYIVQTRQPGGTWYDVPGGPFTSTWVTVNNLYSCTTYEWRVKAHCGYGQYSYWTSSIVFTTMCGSSCNAPSWLGTTNITSTTATWDWSPVSGAISYSIQWRLAGGTWYNLSGGPWTNTWVNVAGLQPGTTYEWRVRSNCSYGVCSSWSYSVSFTTLGSYCNTPTWPSTSNITETTATFSWSAVSGAQSYSVQTRLPNGTWYDIPGGPVYNTWVTVSGFSPNTTYQWRVRANCANGQYSYWTSGTTFTTTGSTCNAPYSLYTANITSTSATLDWSSVSGALSYTVEWRVAGGEWYTLYGSPFTATWASISGLSPGTTYQWRVRANCYNGQYSPWSYIMSFTTLGSSCNTPTWPSTSNITQTSATFSWSAVSGAQGYIVQTRLPNGTWYDLPGGPFTNTWVTVNNLYNCTTYEWRVKAHCGYNQYSNWTYPIVFTTLCGSTCNAPYSLYTASITSTSATLDWSTVSGAISYTVEWRVAGGTWYVLYGSPFTSSWAYISGLQPGTTYEWRVRSNCYNGVSSAWSYILSFSTIGYSCSTPTNPYTSGITQNTATFNWNPVAGAQSYSLQTRLPNGIWYDVPGGPFTPNYITVDGFSPNTTYEWRVRANCGSGQYSNWTYPVPFTTASAGCNAPTWLYTANITSTSATLDWNSGSGAQSYTVEYRVAGGSFVELGGGPFTNTWAYITGLQPGTTYEWRVRSNCANGMQSDWSYILTFATPGFSCNTPYSLSTSNITQTTATFNWAPVSGAQSYSIQTRLPNGTWNDVPGGPFTSTSVTVDGFSPNTTYEWHVRANCSGGQSNWSASVTFTTNGFNPANDNCANAMLLTVGTTCVNTAGSNISATTSLPAPVGTCASAGYKDVWFRFTMPDVPNPVVTIRTSPGTLTDAVAEVYMGADCGTLTYLTCEDDNENGNNSTMPVINLTGNAGATIWVRVWGYYGSAGTFSICVLDYESVNLTSNEDTTEELISGKPLDKLDKESNMEVPVLRISPNPASDILNVRLLQTDKSYVTALVMNDISGKIMFRKDYEDTGVREFQEELDVSGYEPGMYVLQIITTTGIKTEKVMVIDR